MRMREQELCDRGSMVSIYILVSEKGDVGMAKHFYKKYGNKE